MGGTSEEVTSAGSHGASLEHEVIRGALDELNFSDSATVTREDGMPTGGHHASDESLNEDSAKRD